MEDGFLLEQKGHVSLLTLDRPEKLNALAERHLISFGRICRALDEDADVRAVIITGAGRGFSSGADLGKAADANDPDKFAKPVRFMGTRLDFITPLLTLSKPTLAAVNGIAVGAGLGIALACDIRLSGESGAFLANFCDLGLAATDGIPYLLPRLVGVSRAFELLYLGERVDARGALAMGLVNHVYPDEELLPRALEMADKIAAAAPVATQMTKAAVVNGLDRPWPDALAQQELAYVSSVAFGPDDIVESAVARKEGRPPRYINEIPIPKGGET
jgi:enoyl-CoA hydratase